MNQEQILELIRLATQDIKTNFDFEINKLKQQYEPSTTTYYTKQTIDVTIQDNEPLDMIKSLPEFNGSHHSYISWRENSENSMCLYTKGSRRHFAALTILRNKIIGEANNVLTNHGTVLNYDAIIARLDFAYADKRPAHIIEQEMSILKQNNTSLIDYYNNVNEKLTALINKTKMTHGNTPLTNELNDVNRQKALRIFISGLNGNLSNILFSINPPDLPSALAKAQELQANNERSSFANQFHSFTQKNTNNLRFPKREMTHQQTQKVQSPQRMETDSTVNRYREQTNFKPPLRDFTRPTHKQFTPFVPNREPFKRQREDSQQSYRPAAKTERINNINENENTFLGEASDYPIYTEQYKQNE